MDPDALDTESMDAMAAAMGFSSFGAQPSAKRRKYNPHLEDSSSTALPHHKAPSATFDHGKGANAIPLGARAPAAAAPQPTAPRHNNDEISLDDEEDDPEPQYLDTSRPAAPLEAAAAAQPDHAAQAHTDAAVGGVAAGGAGGAYHGHGRGGYRDQRQYANGDRKPWYEDYYDPSSNVNPWERLEKENGLEPLSSDYLTWEESKARWEKEKAAATNVGV